MSGVSERTLARLGDGALMLAVIFLLV